MQIECRRCHNEYDYTHYGEICPQCGSENQLFRSAGARHTMGIEESRIGYFDVNAREERARASDPMYGKSPLRRLKPYLMILVFLCGVVFLGNTLIRYAQRGVSVAPSSPPAASAALGEEGYAFAPSGGMRLTVNAAAVLPEAPAPTGEQWVYVELTLAITDREAVRQNAFVPPVLAGGDAVAMPELPDAVWISEQPLFDSALFETTNSVSGRLFYRLPQDLSTATLFYQQGGNRQQLHLQFTPDSSLTKD